MRFRNKLFSVLLVMCLAVVPFALSGCVGGGGSGGGGNSGGGSGGGEDSGGGTPSGPDMTEYFAGVNTAYIDSTTADAEIVDKYKTLSDNILSVLNNYYNSPYGLDITNGHKLDFEYGGTQYAIFSAESFKNTVRQDLWSWGGQKNDVLYNQDKVNLMTQNLFEATLGLNISNSYLESSLMTYASKVDHKGLFYYEADAIAEYILNYVIGAEVVALDNEKFVDVDNNGTFDADYFYYNVDSSDRMSYLSQIKDYTNTNKRAVASTKSTVWNTINFGETNYDDLGTVDGVKIATSKGVYAGYLFDGEFEYRESQLRYIGNWKVDHKMDYYDMLIAFLQNPTLECKYLSKGVDFVKVNTKALNKGDYTNIRISCFKNYVNTIYKIVYETVADLNWELETKATSDFASINDYGMSTGEESFIAGSTIYKSITLLAKKDITINTISLFFELDASVTTSVDMDVFANYVRKENDTQVSTKAKLGSITINPGRYNITDNDNSVVFDMTIESNDGFSQSTEFYPLGIKEFRLSKANAPYGKYTVAPSDSFIGSSTSYVDPNNDFVELSFVINTNGKQNIKYKFGFMGIAVE